MITKTHICSTLSRLEQHPKHILKTKRCVDRETQCVALSFYPGFTTTEDNGRKGEGCRAETTQGPGGLPSHKGGEKNTGVQRGILWP